MTIVMAAKTNWKYTIVDWGKAAVSGMLGSDACWSSWCIVTASSGTPTNGSIYFPKPALYAHRTQQIRVAEKPYKAINAELMAHFFLTIPPYRMHRTGTLCRPTKVAAVNCQALFPLLCQVGATIGLGAQAVAAGVVAVTLLAAAAAIVKDCYEEREGKVE